MQSITTSFERLLTKLPQLKEYISVETKPVSSELRSKLPTVDGYDVSKDCNLLIPITTKPPSIYVQPKPQIIVQPKPQIIVQPKPQIKNISKEIFSVPKPGSLTLREHHSLLLDDGKFGDIIWTNQIVPKPVPKELNSKYIRIGCIPDGNCFLHALNKAITPLYIESYKNYNTISEDELKRYEISIVFTQEELNRLNIFPDKIFDKPRSPGSVYQINDKVLFQAAMDEFRKTFIRLFRKQIEALFGTDPRITEITRRILPALPEFYGYYLETYTEQEKLRIWNKLMLELKNDIEGNTNLLTWVAYIIAEFANTDVYIITDSQIIKNSKSVLAGGGVSHNYVHGPQIMRQQNDPKKAIPDRRAVVIININANHYELVGKQIVYPNGQSNVVTSFIGDEPIIRILYKEVLESK